MSNFFHFLLGSVRLEVSGRFPERFLNLCGEEKVAFWDLQRCAAGTLRLCVGAHRVHRCRTLARRALCELRIAGGTGLPCFLLGLRRRRALLCGLGFALLGAIVLSQFVLVVQVTGNESLSDSVILTELQRQGFGPGSYGPGVDRRSLANEVLRHLPQLSFLAVNISGVRAQVVVREAAAEPELEDRWAAGDVVAAVDGVILAVDPVIGRSVVEEGQAVLAGELLLSGTEEQSAGDGTGAVLSTLEVRAEGRVLALTRRVLRAAMPLEVSVPVLTGERERWYGLRLWGRSVKFYRESSFFPLSCGTMERTWSLGGLTWTEKTLTERTLRSGRLKREGAQALLEQRLEERLRELMGASGQVLERKLAFSEEDGVLFGTLTASCKEDIAVMVERGAGRGSRSEVAPAALYPTRAQRRHWRLCPPDGGNALTPDPARGTL